MELSWKVMMMLTSKSVSWIVGILFNKYSNRIDVWQFDIV